MVGSLVLKWGGKVADKPWQGKRPASGLRGQLAESPLFDRIVNQWLESILEKEVEGKGLLHGDHDELISRRNPEVGAQHAPPAVFAEAPCLIPIFLVNLH